MFPQSVCATHAPLVHTEPVVHAGQHWPAGHTHVLPTHCRPPVHAGEQLGPTSVGLASPGASTIAS